MLTKVYIA